MNFPFQPVPFEHQNGKIQGYYIGYKQYGAEVPYTYETIQGEPGEAVVRGLQINTKYSVVMQAFNSAGSGPQSHQLVLHTLSADLPTPPNFIISKTTSTSVSVQLREKPMPNSVTRKTFLSLLHLT